MHSKFLPFVNKGVVLQFYKEEKYDELYDILVEPLHQELYRRQTFEFIDELSPGQQLLLAYDYLRTQVGQGGFIQFIQNGYISLLPSIIEQLIMVGAKEMALVLDDVLKVYVLNREQLNKQTSVEEFARLYDEFREFEVLESRYNSLNISAEKSMLDFAVQHLGSYITDSGTFA